MANENRISVLWINHSELDHLVLDQLTSKGIVIRKVSLADLDSILSEHFQLAIINLSNNLDSLKVVQNHQTFLESSLPILARVSRDEFELGIEAMKRGVSNVIASDVDNVNEISTLIRSYALERDTSSSFVFADPISRKLLALTQRVAAADVAVLLSGPTGTGKEVMARVIHESSSRHKGPFVAFNCAALPENLAEDMLFGHEKGSFTGALSSQAGLFEQAQGGTIFLDEIGEMPLHLQVKLLRVLQEKKVTRLGGQKMIDLDIRIVAATNKELKKAILNREFREDLYFRLSAFKLTITGLTQRPLDIIPLAQQFLNGEASPNLSDEVKSQLLNYSWPGNVRELQNVITRALVLANGQMIETRHLIFDDIQLDDLSDNSEQVAFSRTDNAIHFNKKALEPESTESLSNVVRNSEYRTIMSALENTRSRDQAARLLGISTRTLRHKLQRLREDGMAVTRAYAR